jgi:hypothetical protein
MKTSARLLGGTPQTFDAISAFSSLSRSQTGQSKKPASSLKSVSETGKTLLSQGKKTYGSPEIRTQDQSVKSQLASPETLVTEGVSVKLSQEKSQEPDWWCLILAHH